MDLSISYHAECMERYADMEYNVIKRGVLMLGLVVFIAGLVLLAQLIDRRNNKINNNLTKSIHPNAKAGESTNYTMGDNKYSSGGE
ncbi:hypothetical protein [Peribacillus sp. SCS-155]|uniref:hypothetical protein n=1 Tax=Peribacillus sedimenti TaxID=3115297 RepID=UPI0039063BCE